MLLAAAGTAETVEREVVHAGNVLEISVAGRPDLDRLRIVGTTGAIWAPPLGEVPVAGLTPEKVGLVLADLIGRQEGRPAAVTVRVLDDSPAVVRVAGAVPRPGPQTLGASRRLIDVLLAAGGLTTGASGEVVVERREGSFEDGTTVRRVHLPPGEPTPEALAALATPLARGDLVTVIPDDATDAGSERL